MDLMVGNSSAAPSPAAPGSCSFIDDMCLSTIDEDGNFWALLLEVILFAYSFVGLAIVCDDYLVLSLEQVCERLHVREDVAGATFMAFGSAAPEIVVNAVTTLKQATAKATGGGDPDAPSLGVGAIIGSGIIAFLVIPGACALAVHDDIKLRLKRRPLLRDVGTYATALLLLCIFFADGRIYMYEAGILVLLYAVYVCVVVCAPKVRRVFRVKVLGKAVKEHVSFIQRNNNGDAGASNAAASDPLLLAADDIQGNSDLVRIDEVFNARDRETIEEDIDAQGDLVEFKNVSEEGSEDDEEPSTLVGRIIWRMAWPLRMLFKFTCPACEDGSPWASWYPVTFIVSFLWVAIFSFIISTVVERWVALARGTGHSSLGGDWFGLVLVSIGAEIPDTIQSVTVARRGYGSMAVSNAIGSQIINILIGLGLPWLITDLASKGGCIRLLSHVSLQYAATFQFCVVAINLLLLLGIALVLRENKALLTKNKGRIFLGVYVGVLIGFTLVQLLVPQPAPPVQC